MELGNGSFILRTNFCVYVLFPCFVSTLYVFYSLLSNWGQNYNKAEKSGKIFVIVLFYSVQRGQPTVRGLFLHPLDYRILTTKLHSSRPR